jgi:beta-RFAP synthase
MFSFGRTDRPQFGGVGVMVEPPNVEVTIQPADQFTARGDHAERARSFVERATGSWQRGTLPRCEVNVASPPDHIGLGVGTQLGLAIAAALRRFLGLPAMTVEELSASVGRGQRSAVGTYGFELGGLIVDAGHDTKKSTDPPARRLELPPTWRFVLIRQTLERGLAGDRETEAFATLPAVPGSVTDQLWRITNDEIVPAVAAVDCDRFGEAVYRFGRLAGECFAAVQGGAFVSRQVSDMVAAIRAFGITGVGQSSWGPTVFAIAEDDEVADRLVRWMQNQPIGRDCDIKIARPNNSGARISG